MIKKMRLPIPGAAVRLREILQNVPLAILRKVSHFELTIPSTTGGSVLVFLSVFVYLMITWSILRFFQVLYKVDQRMRIITDAYIEDRTNPQP
jgi:hypothetical protein